MMNSLLRKIPRNGALEAGPNIPFRSSQHPFLQTTAQAVETIHPLLLLQLLQADNRGHEVNVKLRWNSCSELAWLGIMHIGCNNAYRNLHPKRAWHDELTVTQNTWKWVLEGRYAWSKHSIRIKLTFIPSNDWSSNRDHLATVVFATFTSGWYCRAGVTNLFETASYFLCSN